jgi:hypothetical protein
MSPARQQLLLHTFWLLPKREIAASQYQSSDTGTSEVNLVVDALELLKAEGEDGCEGSTPDSISVLNERIQRLVDYKSDIILQILKKVVAKRARQQKRSAQTDKRIKKSWKIRLVNPEFASKRQMELPKFDSAACNHKDVEVNHEVVAQLCNYVEMVASMYRHTTLIMPAT